MEDIAKLGLYVDSKGVVRATKNLNKFDKQADKTERKNAKLGKSFGKLKVATVAVGIAAALVLKGFITTAAAFESMKMSLETVTGSAEKADMAFEGIKKFASETPFSVEQVTQSFIKLKALGISPTEANLRSFGNTSSATGKSLNQMIEAVADAATGEFERLKEFGIKARKQGEETEFTFQGITTTVKNSSEDITAYLQSIGENEFGGAMEKQMDTVNGAFSNAGDAIDNLADAMGEAGLNSVVKTLTLGFSDLVNAMASFIDPSTAEQMEKIKGKMEAINLRLEERLKKGHAINQEILQIKQLGEEYAKLADVQKESSGGIDSAGADDGKGKRDAEIAANRAQAETLSAIAAEAIQRDQSLALLAKEDEIAQMAELDRIATEQQIINTSNFAAQAQAKQAEDARMRADTLNKSLGFMMQLTSAKSKKLFLMGKAASIASAIINTYQAVTKTMADTPYPWNIPLAAAQGLAGMVQVQNIKAQKFSGQAHEGMDFVKNTGSYQLERGEMVVDKGTSKQVRNGLGGGGVSLTFAPVVQAFDAEDVMKNKEKLFNGLRTQFVEWMDNEGLRFAT